MDSFTTSTVSTTIISYPVFIISHFFNLNSKRETKIGILQTTWCCQELAPSANMNIYKQRIYKHSKHPVKNLVQYIYTHIDTIIHAHAYSCIFMHILPGGGE